MDRDEVVSAILRERVIAIVRLGEAAPVVPVSLALHAGGLGCLEVSLTTPGALAAIAELARRLPGALIGAGTVCTPDEARAALDAGARFLVTPVTVPELLDEAHARGAPVVMGALTPTEIHAAWRAGADLVKLFPASAFGPGYLKAVLAPFPSLRLVPTGGVDARNAREWLAAGAAALGVGGALTDPAAIAQGRLEALTDHARALRESVR